MKEEGLYAKETGGESPKGKSIFLPWIPAFQALILAVLVLLLFADVAFTGKGTFLGWYDNAVQYHPWMYHLVGEWRNWQIPLWDFSQLSGTSFIGEWQTGVFYPVNILYALLGGNSSPRSLDCLILAHFIYGAIGAMLLFKSLGLRAGGAVLGALTLMTVGPIAMRASAQANIFVGLCHIPWVLWLMNEALLAENVRSSLRFAGGSGLVLGVCCLAGHPQPFIHGTVLLLVWTLFADKVSNPNNLAMRNRLVLFCLAMLFASLLGAIQLAASTEYFRNAYRWVGLSAPISGLQTVPYKSYVIYQLHWGDLPGLVSASTGIKDCGVIATAFTALIFAFIGLFCRGRLRWIGFGLGVFGILVALGDCTFFGPLIYHTPWLNKVREPARALLFYQIGVALLAALGADAVLKKWEGRRWPLFVVLSGLIPLLFVFDAYWHGLTKASPTSDPHSAALFNGPSPITDLLETLSKDSGENYRIYVTPKDILPPNLGNLFSVRSATGHSSSMFRLYFDYLSKDWNISGKNWDNLGVRYVVAETPPGPAFKQLFEYKGMYVYERPTAKPVIRAEAGGNWTAPGMVTWKGNSVIATFRNMPQKSRVVMAQVVSKGWRVTVNGVKMPVKPLGNLMSVDAPSGNVEVRFYYRPSWLNYGLAAWAIAALAFGFLYLNRPISEWLSKVLSLNSSYPTTRSSLYRVIP